MVGGLPYEIADRQAARALRLLRDMGVAAEAKRVPLAARHSKGSHVLIVASFERTRTGHGVVGGREGPEQVADSAVKMFDAHLRGRAAVDPHLGDQLLLPASLCAAALVPPPPGVVPATRYTVSAVTKHLLTNAEVIQRFLDVEISVFGREGEEGEVRVQPPGGGLEVVLLGK